MPEIKTYKVESPNGEVERIEAHGYVVTRCGALLMLEDGKPFAGFSAQAWFRIREVTS